MRLQNLEVDGFRCLSNFKVIFEEDLTLIVGENDCGKTSPSLTLLLLKTAATISPVNGGVIIGH